MRKFLSGLMLLGGLVAIAAPAAAQTAGKVAYVDSRRIIAEAPGAREAQTTLNTELSGFEAQLKPLADSVQAMMAEYEQKSVMLSPDAKKQKEDEIRLKQQAFQQRRAQLEQQIEKRQAELVEPIMDRIEKVIEEIRVQGSYAIIFDKAANGMVAADPTLDLTDQVIARLKATASTATPRQ